MHWGKLSRVDSESKMAYTKRNMKICFIHNLYAPYAVGGAERVVEELVHDAQAAGHSAVVITITPAETFLGERNVANEVPVYRIKSQYIFPYQSLWNHGFVGKALWHVQDIYGKAHLTRIREILEEEAPDIVHTHNLMGVGFQLPRLIQELGIQHRHTVHDVQLVEPSGILPWNHEKDSFIQRWHSRIMRKLFSSVDEVIYPTVFMKDFYESRGFFQHATSQIDDRIHLKQHISKKRNSTFQKILFVGSLVSHKGIGVLMQIWEALPATDARELHIVGDGELKEHVDTWAAGDHRVTVYGRLDKAKVHELYDDVDVLLFPSTCIENRPNVIIEAQQHGLPVIAADTGGVSELMQEHDILVEPANIKEFVQAIVKNES